MPHIRATVSLWLYLLIPRIRRLACAIWPENDRHYLLGLRRGLKGARTHRQVRRYSSGLMGVGLQSSEKREGLTDGTD